MEDRLSEIISLIVRTIFAAPDGRDLENRVLTVLAAKGFEASDVGEAFRMLGQVTDSLRAETAGRKGIDRPRITPRALTDYESLRMSDDAIQLFRTWQELQLMTLDESEEILQQVMMSGVGDVDAGDLVKIAENCTSRGSNLHLYLTSSAGPLQ